MTEQGTQIEGPMITAAKSIPPFVTVRQFAKYFSWPSESGLRWMIFKAKANDLDGALLRIGRRVLIDTQKFEAWVRSHGSQTPK